MHELARWFGPAGQGSIHVIRHDGRTRCGLRIPDAARRWTGEVEPFACLQCQRGLDNEQQRAGGDAE